MRKKNTKNKTKNRLKIEKSFRFVIYIFFNEKGKGNQSHRKCIPFNVISQTGIYYDAWLLFFIKTTASKHRR